MGIKVTGAADVKKMLQDAAKAAVKNVVEQFNMVGMETVAAIRTGEVSNWDDKTTNLRSSIGYLVTVDGKIVHSNGFEAVRSEGAEGAKNGRTFAEEIVKKYPRGIALIVVAGMEYAAYVEGIEGKSVLAGGELFAKARLKRALAGPRTAVLD